MERPRRSFHSRPSGIDCTACMRSPPAPCYFTGRRCSGRAARGWKTDLHLPASHRPDPGGTGPGGTSRWRRSPRSRSRSRPRYGAPSMLQASSLSTSRPLRSLDDAPTPVGFHGPWFHGLVGIQLLQRRRLPRTGDTASPPKPPCPSACASIMEPNRSAGYLHRGAFCSEGAFGARCRRTR